MKRTAKRRAAWGAVTVAAALCAGCSSTQDAGSPQVSNSSSAAPVRGYKVGNPYQIKGIWYYPKADYSYSEVGIASWYGPGFDGKATANGEVYDMNDLTAAHKTLPMPCVVRVTNLENGRSIKLRVNDRGPFVGDRIIDVSRRGAQLLGFYNAGTAQVKVEIVEDESRMLAAGYDVPADRSVASRDTGPEIGQITPSVEQQALLTSASADTAAIEVSQAQIVTEPLPSFQSTAYNSGAPEATEIGAYSPSTEVAYAVPAATYSRQMTAIATPRTAAHEHSASGYYVQAGAFADASRAHRVSQQLAAIGPTQVTSSRVNGRDLLRVRLGPYNSDADVERALSRASQAGFPEARIVAD